MDMTTLLTALAIWFVTSCLVAWAVGRASSLGNTSNHAQPASGLAERRQRSADRRLGGERRQAEDRRQNTRATPDRRIADRRLLARRLNWAA